MARIHVQASRQGTKKRWHSQPTSSWRPAPEYVETGLKNPSDMLPEEIRTKLEAELNAINLAMHHVKTNVVYVRSPLAQRPTSQFQSSSNVGEKKTGAEANPTVPTFSMGRGEKH